MTKPITQAEDEQLDVSSAENHKGIENHIIAAKHYKEAAKHHIDAAKHHAQGNHEKAYESTIKAQGHSWFARKYEMEDAGQHAMIKYHNNLISHVLI